VIVARNVERGNDDRIYLTYRSAESDFPQRAFVLFQQGSIVLVLCWNFGGQESTQAKIAGAKPHIHFA
jgi:hypothetical protein